MTIPPDLDIQIDDTWRIVSRYYGDIVRIAERGADETDQDIVKMLAGVVMMELSRKNINGEL